MCSTANALESDHFDPYAASRERSRRSRTPLDEILVEGSTFSRTCLKQRLYDGGLKRAKCELCGQDDNWHGKKMGLILDHANGVRDDNRLENLRIICPNCAATLDTHCGRKNRESVRPRSCLRCDRTFVPKYRGQRYCSSACGSRWDRKGVKRPGARKVERPPHQELLREVNRLGYLAVGRKYGVSDNAIRKWLRQYEREQLLASGGDPSVAEIPKRTWPNRRRDRQDEAA
jgi:transposase-like protein